MARHKTNKITFPLLLLLFLNRRNISMFHKNNFDSLLILHAVSTSLLFQLFLQVYSAQHKIRWRPLEGVCFRNLLHPNSPTEKKYQILSSVLVLQSFLDLQRNLWTGNCPELISEHAAPLSSCPQAWITFKRSSVTKTLCIV